MKVILFALNSSYTHTNLAVRYLKSVLDNAGAETEIIERNLKDKRDAVLYDLYAGNAAVYGFSAYIWNVNELHQYAAALKLLRPDCKIIFGGPEVSFADDEYINNHPYIDYIVRGEGEDAVVSLFKNGSDKRIIDGTSFRGFTQTDNMYTTVPRGSIIYYESSRGCPYNCAFCLSSLTDGIRAKPAEAVLSDLLRFEKLTEEIKIIKFVDRTFNYDRERSKTIWRALRGDEYSLKYHFEICADLLDDESIVILSKMPEGKIQMEIGVQSTNPATLEACMRQSNIPLVLDNTRLLHNGGNIHIHCDLIAGLPYESYDRFAVSYDQAHSCCDFVQLGFLKLLPGSYLRENSDCYGIVYNPEPPYTILFNNDISYEELYRLKRIALISERYGKTGCKNTMDYIFKNVNSPFKFYEGIEEICKSNFSSLSQYKARELLFSHANNLVDPVLLAAYMRLDWLLYETGKCPPYLRGGSYNERTLNKAKNDFITEFKVKHPSKRAPSVEARVFEFDMSKIYLIDRINHIYYIRGVD